MSEYQLEYLQMKEKYLALKNEMGLYQDLDGASLLGKARRAALGVTSGPVSVAIDFYKKIFKTQKVTPDTIKGTAKVHNNLKIKYFEAKKTIDNYEVLVNTYSKTEAASLDPELVPCFSPKNKTKIFKKKYPKSAYETVVIYPFERAVAAAIRNKSPTSTVIQKASQLIQAYGVLTGHQKGKHISKWDTYASNNLDRNLMLKNSYRDENFYMWQVISDTGSDFENKPPLYNTNEQFSEMERKKYEAKQMDRVVRNERKNERRQAKSARKKSGKSSGRSVNFRSPIKIGRKKSGGDYDSYDEHDEYGGHQGNEYGGHDSFTSHGCGHRGYDDCTGGGSSDDENYFIY
jgi:hypothetical protein